MGHVTGVNDGVGVNDLNITDLSEGARTPSRYHLPSYLKKSRPDFSTKNKTFEVRIKKKEEEMI